MSLKGNDDNDEGTFGEIHCDSESDDDVVDGINVSCRTSNCDDGSDYGVRNDRQPQQLNNNVTWVYVGNDFLEPQSPLSATRFANEALIQSTPFLKRQLSDVVTQRREPMGGEDAVDSLGIPSMSVSDGNEILDDVDVCGDSQTNRPPLIGQASGSSFKTFIKTVDDKDSLAEKVELLLCKTRGENDINEDFHNEIETDTQSLDDIQIDRSEPEGTGISLQMQMNTLSVTAAKKLVHYTDSESEDEEKAVPSSNSSTKSCKSFQPLMRLRSYSITGTTEPLITLRQPLNLNLQTRVTQQCNGNNLKRNDNLMTSPKESTGTQTFRSFLLEQAQHVGTNSSQTGESSEKLSRSESQNFSSNSQSSDHEGLAYQPYPVTSVPLIATASQSTTQPLQTIYIPTGRTKGSKKSRNNSETSSGTHLDRAMDVLKSHSTTSSKSTSSSEACKENKPVNGLVRQSDGSLSSLLSIRHNVPNQITDMKRKKSSKSNSRTSTISLDQKSSGLERNSSKAVSSSSQRTTDGIRGTSCDTVDISTITQQSREFKNLVERQKNYLKCLQRELLRLEKIEKLFAKNIKNKSAKAKDATKNSPEYAKSASSKENVSTNTNTHSARKKIYTPTTSLPSSSSNLYQNETSNKSSSTDTLTSHLYSQKFQKPFTRYRNAANKKPLHKNVILTPKLNSIGIQTTQSLLKIDDILIQSDETAVKVVSKKVKPSVSWSIPIQKRSSVRQSKLLGVNKDKVDQSKKSQVTSNSVSLQHAFNQKCSNFIRKCEKRTKTIRVMKEMRQNTFEERKMSAAHEYQRNVGGIIKPRQITTTQCSTKQFFSHREMRMQTERIYTNLTEVKAKKEKLRKEEDMKAHRLMSQIYARKLAQNALKGKVTWSITQRVYS